VTIDALRARIASETCVLVFEDGEPVVLRLWFCAKPDAPPYGRWFMQPAKLPDPTTSLPGEWIELWREDADAGADGEQRKRLWCELWKQAAEQAAHIGWYLRPARSDAARIDDGASDPFAQDWAGERSRFWLAFSPDGRVVSSETGAKWPHPASWLLRQDYLRKRQSPRPAYRRHLRRFDRASRSLRKAVWIETRNAIRAAQIEQPGVLFWSYYARRPRETHFEGWFCGARRRVYGFEIVSVRHEYEMRVREQAEAELEARQAQPEASLHSFDDLFRGSLLIPAGAGLSGGRDPYVYQLLAATLRSPRLDQYERALDTIAARIADERTRAVVESTTVGPGRGLRRQVRFVVAAENLTRETVDETIRRFLDDGERDWQGTERYTYDAEALKALRSEHEPAAGSGMAVSATRDIARVPSR
jgi:hypothetical protein